jgi:DNA-3-methyladenine glycosylase II
LPNTQSTEYTIQPIPPYSLSYTAARLAAYPEIVDCYDGDVYRRLIFVGRRPVLCEVIQHGAPSRAVLQVKLSGNVTDWAKAKTEARLSLERVLGIGYNVQPFYRRFRNDPILGPLIRDFRGLRVAGRASVWEALVQIVLSQQINLSFAGSIQCDLARAFGQRASFDGRTYFRFPSPRRLAGLTSQELRRYRLSRAKAETLIRAAKAFVDGSLSQETLEELSDEEAIEYLSRIRGIGRWTAEFTLLRGLGRFDVFPGGDLGVVKYLAQGILGRTGKAREQEMREFAESWRPYRGLALIYTYAELARRSREPTS